MNYDAELIRKCQHLDPDIQKMIRIWGTELLASSRPNGEVDPALIERCQLHWYDLKHLKGWEHTRCTALVNQYKLTRANQAAVLATIKDPVLVRKLRHCLALNYSYDASPAVRHEYSVREFTHIPNGAGGGADCLYLAFANYLAMVISNNDVYPEPSLGNQTRLDCAPLSPTDLYRTAGELRQRTVDWLEAHLDDYREGGNTLGQDLAILCIDGMGQSADLGSPDALYDQIFSVPKTKAEIAAYWELVQRLAHRYLAYMRKRSTYSGEPETRALAHLFKVNVTVLQRLVDKKHSDKLVYTTGFRVRDAIGTVYLLHLRRLQATGGYDHYEALFPGQCRTNGNEVGPPPTPASASAPKAIAIDPKKLILVNFLQTFGVHVTADLELAGLQRALDTIPPEPALVGLDWMLDDRLQLIDRLQGTPYAQLLYEFLQRVLISYILDHPAETATIEHYLNRTWVLASRFATDDHPDHIDGALNQIIAAVYAILPYTSGLLDSCNRRQDSTFDEALLRLLGPSSAGQSIYQIYAETLTNRPVAVKNAAICLFFRYVYLPYGCLLYRMGTAPPPLLGVTMPPSLSDIANLITSFEHFIEFEPI